MQGNGWIGGFEKDNGVQGQPGATAGDQLTGTLTLREFLIEELLSHLCQALRAVRLATSFSASYDRNRTILH